MAQEREAAVARIIDVIGLARQNPRKIQVTLDRDDVAELLGWWADLREAESAKKVEG